MLSVILSGGYTGTQIIYILLIVFIAITLSFSVHEFAHSFVATKLGDNTSKNMGRLTLNPLAHLDPIGTIMILLLGFGWGKPVMVNSNNLTKLKSRRLSVILVNLAGVAANYLLSLICCIIMVFLVVFAEGRIATAIYVPIYELLSYTNSFCMLLLGFNLIPIPPLDGFHVLQELLPSKIKNKPGYYNFVRYAPMILMAVFVLGRVSGISIFSLIVGYIALPFNMLNSLVMQGLLFLLSNFI